jgi:hypothetical protein
VRYCSRDTTALMNSVAGTVSPQVDPGPVIITSVSKFGGGK